MPFTLALSAPHRTCWSQRTSECFLFNSAQLHKQFAPQRLLLLTAVSYSCMYTPWDCFAFVCIVQFGFRIVYASHPACSRTYFTVLFACISYASPTPIPRHFSSFSSHPHSLLVRLNCNLPDFKIPISPSQLLCLHQLFLKSHPYFLSLLTLLLSHF